MKNTLRDDYSLYTSDNKKVKHIIIVYDYASVNGGAARIAITSAIGLAEKGYDVTYFSAVGPVCDELEKSNINIICMELDDINHGNRFSAIKRGIWNKQAGKVFSKLLSKYSPDSTLIHIHGWVKALSSAIVSTSIKSGFETVITLHDYFTLCPNGGFYNYTAHTICRRAPMSFACISCNCDKRNYSQKLWRVIRQFVQDRSIRNNNKIHYISLCDLNENLIKTWVVSNSFYRVQNPVDLIREESCDVESSNVFLFVGRLSKEKGADLFCEALRRLRNHNERVEGIVIGEGELSEELKKKYSEIHFTGWKTKKEVGQYMGKSRALVFPSKWYEAATPLVVLEALSCGLPVIVSDCTAATEDIVDMKNGRVFESENTNDLVEKMESLLDNSTVLKIHKNIQRTFIREKYQKAIYIDRLIAVYNDILAQRQGDIF